MKCGLIKNYKGNLLPACKEELDKRGKCPVHCRARLRGERAGKFCVNFHLKGKRGCRMHGGKTKTTLGNPNAKSLAYSRYLPVLSPSLKKRFENAMRQSDALSLMPDIYLLDARIETVLQRQNGETSEAWAEALKAFDQFAGASEAKNKKGQVEALTMLGALLRRGSQEEGDWKEVRNLWDQRRRMVVDERRNRLEHSVHKGIVFQLIEALVKSLERNVEDLNARERIGADIARFTGATVLTPNQADDLGEIG